MVVLKLGNKIPKTKEGVFIAKTATIIGNVFLEEDVSIWYGAVLRGDVGNIFIEKGTNVQDNSVIHILTGGEVRIGSYTTIGHNVIVHNARIGDNCLIGNGAIILDNVEIGSNSLVAAGSVLPPNKKYPSGVLIMGVPARVIRELTSKEIETIKENALEYIKLKEEHKKGVADI